MALGIANTPLINYFFYKQTTTISTANIPCCNPFSAIADGGNGQLVVTTSADLTLLEVGNAITLGGTTNYDGDYSIISKTPNTFNISGTFVGSEAGTWELASSTTGASAGDPLDFGQLFFFDNNDLITPLDTYQDRELTIPNPNPIILDALGSYPPIYLLDQPYYIVIKDKFNNLVATLENYLPDNSVEPGNSNVPENLFANYGFDTTSNQGIYDINTSLPINGIFGLSAGWEWEISTTQADVINRYAYNVVSANGLIANPKNELILTTTNVLLGKTTNQISAFLGSYNAFQNIQLGLSIYTQVISGGATTLECELIRTRNKIDETPISIGSIAISPIQSQQTLLFTVPPLLDNAYQNDDSIRFVIRLPLTQDFVYGFTGTWLQQTPDGIITPLEESGSKVAAKEFFGNTFKAQQQDPQYPIRGLPVTVGEIGVLTLNQTGSIFLANRNATFNYALRMGDPLDLNDAGPQLLRNEILNGTLTNRLIDYLRLQGMLRSRHTFIASTGGSNIVTIQTGIGTVPNSTWTSLAAPRITQALVQQEFFYRLSATTGVNGLVQFTFADNFAATTLPFNPQYTNAGGNVYNPATLIGAPLIVFFGTPDFEQGLVTTPVVAQNAMKYRFAQSIQSGGSAVTPAQQSVKFHDVSNVSYPIYKGSFSTSGYNPLAPAFVSPFIFNHNVFEVSIYNGLFDNISNFYPAGPTRIFVDAQASLGALNPTDLKEAYNLKLNYISYNDTALNPPTQGFVPPRLIKFTVDGADYAPNLIGSLSTLQINLDGSDNAAMVGAKIVRFLNTSFIETFTIVSTPNNGDILEISNDITNFNVIFWDTNQSQPANPNTRIPIYVEYTAAQSTITIAQSAADAINNAVAGVPRASDLGLSFPVSQLADITEHAYFMMI